MNFLKKKLCQLYVRTLDVCNVDDVLMTKARYYLKTGEKLNLEHPTSFTHKIQWLKLFKYTEDYGKYVDKYLVRKYVEEKLGNQYLNELLAVYTTVEDIDFDALPSQFAIKASHGSGYNIIVPDKNKLNFKKAKRQLNKYVKTNYYKKNREKIYKNLKPYIIAEKFLDQKDAEYIVDYKFYCFDGKPESVWVKTFYQDKYRNCYYTLDWKRIEGDTNKKDYLPIDIKRPDNFDEMIEVSKKLSQGFKFVRIDLYSVAGKVYFGELTFFPWGGMRLLTVESLNERYGNKILLD